MSRFIYQVNIHDALNFYIITTNLYPPKRGFLYFFLNKTD
jgi:hypothetical protein